MTDTPTLSRVTRIHETTDERFKRLIESDFIPPEKVSKHFAGKGHPGDAEMIDWLIEQLEMFIALHSEKKDAELIQEAG